MLCRDYRVERNLQRQTERLVAEQRTDRRAQHDDRQTVFEERAPNRRAVGGLDHALLRPAHARADRRTKRLAPARRTRQPLPPPPAKPPAHIRPSKDSVSCLFLLRSFLALVAAAQPSLKAEYG